MAVTTVNTITRVYIFIDTRRIRRTLFFDIVRFTTKGLNLKCTSHYGYKYILNRWARIVFDFGIGPTHLSWRIHARMDIGVCGVSIHTAYGVPPPNALPTLRIHQILYIITYPTDTDYVRTEIPIPTYVVLE